MKKLVEEFWGRALKIAHHYESDQLTFADLTGLVDDYSAAFHESLSGIPDSDRLACCLLLEQRLLNSANNKSHTDTVNSALAELAGSVNRIPIY
ncbi:hypothetical protein [Neopusillimonas maritima]|jgi:hypothetical protein|uniref:Uncharacterized protein n=1 Tax=Neopusillimonas maritima TaxID=2026239 RepID=A0ABX9MST3_9BURK|nr:hypothetical protein [Neopusillimonas maritima]RII81965.1 hypothetical protein CJO09_13230 [Neopusillimonas maritima]